jgi:putative transposase
MTAVLERSEDIGVTLACEALTLPTSTFYRSLQPARHTSRPAPARKIGEAGRSEVLTYLHDDRFVDKTPAETYATLLDEGIYLCSIRTMYRILDENKEVRERRQQRKHPHYTKPELQATAPNQVWSWDITKLRGPAKGNMLYLYVIIDIFSRYIVGWMIAERETACLATRLISETCKKEQICNEQLVIHSDRGAPMTANTTAQLMASLGVTKSHSRPRVSNDNPYSESQFKTLKYNPSFPGTFGCIEDARSYLTKFFRWYNHGHHHSGIGMMTPFAMHSGKAHELWQQRQHVLKDLTTVKVANITICILFTYDGFERVLVFDKKMIIRK